MFRDSVSRLKKLTLTPKTTTDMLWTINEEILAVYYASRRVWHRAISEILTLKLNSGNLSVRNKIHSICGMEKNLQQEKLWSLPDVDAWIRKNIGDDQSLEDLLKWDQSIEDIVAKVGLGSRNAILLSIIYSGLQTQYFIRADSF